MSDTKLIERILKKDFMKILREIDSMAISKYGKQSMIFQTIKLAIVDM